MRFLGFFFFRETAPVLQIYAQFTHNLKKTHSKRRETGPLGFRFPPFFFAYFSPAPMLSSEAPHPQCTGWRLHRPGQPYSQTGRKRRPGLVLAHLLAPYPPGGYGDLVGGDLPLLVFDGADTGHAQYLPSLR